MNNSFFKFFYRIFIGVTALILFLCLFFAPIISITPNFSDAFYLNDAYVWPTPGYTTINSYFGKRPSPTAGASSYHKGIDIGAAKDSLLIAICDGKITFTGFLGGGGFTITLSKDNMKITYCHVSPNYIVEVGDIVKKGQIIGYVGPKNVYGVMR